MAQNESEEGADAQMGLKLARQPSFEHKPQDCGAKCLSPALAESSVGRLIFFDLDNTLIPTSWIMQQWHQDEGNRKDDEARSTATAMNAALERCGVFDAIGELLLCARAASDAVVIVTNAGQKTVENFYLSLILPQLRRILEQLRIPCRSTEEWVNINGPLPSPENEEAFREFYTVVKYNEFKRHFYQKLLVESRSAEDTNAPADTDRAAAAATTTDARTAAYSENAAAATAAMSTVTAVREASSLETIATSATATTASATATASQDSIPDGLHESKETKTLSSANKATNKSTVRADGPSVSSESLPQNRRIDVISVGDQPCEIAAACRLKHEFSDQINQIKLLLISDPYNLKFSNQTPTSFRNHLLSLRSVFIELLNSTVPSRMNHFGKFHRKFLKRGMAYWIPAHSNLAYSVGNIDDFPTEFPPFVDTLNYLNRPKSFRPPAKTTSDSSKALIHPDGNKDRADLSSISMTVNKNGNNDGVEALRKGPSMNATKAFKVERGDTNASLVTTTTSHSDADEECDGFPPGGAVAGKVAEQHDEVTRSDVSDSSEDRSSIARSSNTLSSDAQSSDGLSSSNPNSAGRRSNFSVSETSVSDASEGSLMADAAPSSFAKPRAASTLLRKRTKAERPSSSSV